MQYLRGPNCSPDATHYFSLVLVSKKVFPVFGPHTYSPFSSVVNRNNLMTVNDTTIEYVLEREVLARRIYTACLVS